MPAKAGPDRTSAEENRYDPVTGTLVFSTVRGSLLRNAAAGVERILPGIHPAAGLPPSYIKDSGRGQGPDRLLRLGRLGHSRNRPGKDYSYTNNWPYEPTVGNRPDTRRISGAPSASSLSCQVSGSILFVFGRFDYLGWRGEEIPATTATTTVFAWKLTPSQWATGWFFAS